MSIEYCLALGAIIVPIAAVVYLEWWYWHRHSRLLAHDLHVRGQKREILEAIRLIQYGAREEGIELLEKSTLFKDAE